LVGKYIPIPQFQLIADTLGIDINTESIFDGYICIYFDDCACISLEYNLINFDMFFQEC
jgi:hypothetical protein